MSGEALRQPCPCSSCGRPVSPINDAELLACQLTLRLSDSAHHLFPVVDGGGVVCIGSPRWAQYLFRQRDPRSRYDYGIEVSVREAYRYLVEQFGAPEVKKELTLTGA